MCGNQSSTQRVCLCQLQLAFYIFCVSLRDQSAVQRHRSQLPMDPTEDGVRGSYLLRTRDASPGLVKHDCPPFAFRQQIQLYACMGSLCRFIVASCTLRGMQRSQNCNNEGTTSGPVRYKAKLQSCRTSPVGGWVLTCECVYSWQLYSAASLEHQDAGTKTCYPTQLHYPDTEPTSP